MILPKKFIIYDTEFTSWEGSQERKWSLSNEHCELVAIGALKVEFKDNDFKILDKFKILFIPRINKKLSDYFINLTGITNKDIKEKGIDFEIGINIFLDFCDGFDMYSYGNDYHIFEENFNLYKINNFLVKNNFKDIIPFFKLYNINTENYSSGTIHRHFNIVLGKENVHDPLFDSISIFKTIKYLKKLKITTFKSPNNLNK